MTIALMATMLLGVGATSVGTASADTAPVDPTQPETVSAAMMPTVQINGVVWAQVISGNRVYATGQFTQARPAGAAAGTNETPRSNLLAYDLTTGALITSWAPSLNAQGKAIAASADGSTIYVGGDFDRVGATSRSRIAAISASTGAVLPFNPGANTTVASLAINNATNTVYYGGYFTSTGAGSGNTPRQRLAAADGTTGALRPWAPRSDREVLSMVVHPASGRVIVGGNMNTLNDVTQRGMGSLDGVTGAVEPWAVNQIIQNYGDSSAISALTTDGEQIFGTGWAFFGGGATANFEGVFSADPMTGALNWIDGGRGDNYSLTVTGDVVYTAGHPHDWGMLDFNPQYDPYQFQYSIAINKHRSPTLTNAYGTPDIWQPFMGRPAAQPLHWLPSLSLGTYTGQYQAGWSIASNDNYVVIGGEFPRVNGVAQQGLVRFAKRSVNPVADTIQGAAELKPTLTAQGPGTVRVAWTAPWDRDNQRLKVEVLRGANVATAAAIKTFQADSTWWNRAPLGFVDTTAPPGSSQTYRVRVTDPFGNALTSASTAITVPGGTPPASPYSAAVLADNPANQWRLGDASGTVGVDRAGSNDLTLSAEAQRNTAGALLNEPDTATTYPGSSNTATVQGVSPYWQSGPQTFSLEAWVNTTTSSGGKIIGFGSSNTGRSSTNGTDRQIYMSNSGQLYFGVRPDMETRQTINSPASYRDGQWHQVVGTLSSDGMKLFVDGALVASNASVTKAQVYRGYWRVGGDRLSSWPAAPTREAINARLDEIAVYPTALTLAQVRAHYQASGRSGGANTPPTASFTATNQDLTANVTSTSTDTDGTIVSYAWDFGDGGTATGPTASHPYDHSATYDVSLTVTDDDGAARTVHHDVTVTDPAPNQGPNASFTENVQFLNATLTSNSTDPDGTIATYDWDFGDGSPHGTEATVTHQYGFANSWPVTLTVTDDDGAPSTTSHQIVTTDPPANQPPNPSFTSSSVGLLATLTSTSTDVDGQVVDWAWDFGDGTFGSGQSVQHLFPNPGTLDVKLTVKDDDGDTSFIVQPVTVSAAPVGFAADQFSRTVANGLGSADLGGPWTLSGAATSFSVSGGAGRIAGAVSGNRAGYLAAVRQRDVEITSDLSLDRAATGGGAYMSVIGRRVSNGNDYRLKLRYLAGGTVAAYLVRTDSGVETTLASTTVAGLTLSPGDVLRVKLQVNGAASTNVRAKVWRANAAEPAAWLLTNTSAAPTALQVAGDTGLLLYVSGSWTGIVPTAAIDNLAVGPITTP